MIFIEQYFQGKDFDGGLLIPFGDIEGNFELYIYQTSIHKKEKFSREYIYSQYIKIKSNFEEIFGISIVNGYFSYILYYENPDIETKIHCQNNLIECLYYSIKKNELVDTKGKIITKFLTNKSLIYESSELKEFSNFQLQLDFFKSCFIKKIKTNKKVISAKINKNYLNKKIKLSLESEEIKDEEIKVLKEKIKNDIKLINEITSSNNLIIEKIKSLNIDTKEFQNLLTKEEKISIRKEESILKLKQISKQNKTMLKAQKDKSKKLKKILLINNVNIEEEPMENTIDEEKNEKINKQENISFNIQKKISLKVLPENIARYLKQYTKYSELAKIFDCFLARKYLFFRVEFRKKIALLFFI